MSIGVSNNLNQHQYDVVEAPAQKVEVERDFSTSEAERLIEHENALQQLALQRFEQLRAEETKSFSHSDEQETAIQIENAKTAASENGRRLSQEIARYKIRDQSALTEIAQIALKTCGAYISMYISNYGVEDQNALIEIANASLDAPNGTLYTSRYIKNYSINDQNELIKLAKKCAATDGENLSQYISNYGIEDQNELIAIAKIAALNSSSAMLLHIQNYKITDQTELAEITKSFIYKDDTVSRFIADSGITDQNLLIEIAKLDISAHGVKAFQFIRNYHITDQTELAEFAKSILYRDNDFITSSAISRSGITDQNLLTELAILGVSIHGNKVLNNIHHYGIKDKNILIELVKISAHINAKNSSYINAAGLPYILKKQGINNQLLLTDIAKLSIRYGDLLHTLDSSLNPIESLDDSIMEYIKNDHLSLQETKSLVEEIRYYSLLVGISKNQNFVLVDYIEKLYTKLYDEKTNYVENYNQLIKNKYIDFLILQYANCCTLEIPLTKTLQNIFRAILLHGNTLDKVDLCHLFIDGIKKHGSENFLRRYSQLTTEANHLLLPMIVLCHLELESDSLYAKETAAYVNTIHQIMRSSTFRKVYRDANSSLKFRMIKAFLALEHTACIPSQQKIKLLANILQLFSQNPSLCLVELDRIYLLSQLNRLHIVVNSIIKNKNYSIEDIRSLFLEQLHNFLPFDYKIISIDDFIQTQLSMRVPYGLLTYFSGIQNMKDKMFIPQAVSMIASIVSGSHKADRYRLENHLHLQQIFENHANLFELWKNPPTPETSMCEAPPTSHQVDVFQYLKEKIEDGHLPEASPALLAFIQGKDSIENAEDPITSLCRSVCNDPPASPEQKKRLRALSTVVPAGQFKRDINDLITLISSQKTSTKQVTLVNTDDWQDLFLSGTEVLGSCQHIQGNPSLNGCLMAYVMDGKYRMLAVKNSEGTIQLRAMLRLMQKNDPARTPALFLERTYTSVHSSSLTSALYQFAVQQAADMKMELYVQYQNPHFNTTLATGTILHSVSSNCLREYVDGGSLGVVNGQYQISYLYRVTD